MELGKRIKAARLEAGLSQRQLCGDMITRNMLSLIENGSARPSMDTLRYLAQKTGKSLSWFLEEEAVTSPNQDRMAQARACWQNRDAAGVLTALEDYRSPDAVFDPEQGLLRYLALLQLAQQALETDRIPYARTLLQQAQQCESPYLTEDAPLQLLLAKAGLSARLEIDGTLLQKAALALEEKELSRCLSLLEAADHPADPHWQLLRGLCAFEAGDYPTALIHLRAAESSYPGQTIPKLEICCRETGDYKGAYEYACLQRL